MVIFMYFLLVMPKQWLINGAILFGKDTVAAVAASAHDEIGSDGVPAIFGLAEDDAAARIGVASQPLLNGFDLIDVHISFLQSFVFNLLYFIHSFYNFALDILKNVSE